MCTYSLEFLQKRWPDWSYTSSITVYEFDYPLAFLVVIVIRALLSVMTRVREETERASQKGRPRIKLEKHAYWNWGYNKRAKDIEYKENKSVNTSNWPHWSWISSQECFASESIPCTINQFPFGTVMICIKWNIVVPMVPQSF